MATPILYSGTKNASSWAMRAWLALREARLFGQLSLADLMLVPTVVRLTRHDLELAPWQRSKSWTVALLERPAVVEWLSQADVLPHIWLDDYLPPADARLPELGQVTLHEPPTISHREPPAAEPGRQAAGSLLRPPFAGRMPSPMADSSRIRP